MIFTKHYDKGPDNTDYNPEDYTHITVNKWDQTTRIDPRILGSPMVTFKPDENRIEIKVHNGWAYYKITSWNAQAEGFELELVLSGIDDE